MKALQLLRSILRNVASASISKEDGVEIGQPSKKKKAEPKAKRKVSRRKPRVEIEEQMNSDDEEISKTLLLLSPWLSGTKSHPDMLML